MLEEAEGRDRNKDLGRPDRRAEETIVLVDARDNTLIHLISKWTLSS